MAFPAIADVLSSASCYRDRHRPAEANISVIVGRLYAPEDERRDAGFSIFYMGINLGAFIGAARLRLPRPARRLALGFAAAGVGMVLGLIQYVLGGSTSATPVCIPPTPDRPRDSRAEEARNSWAGRVIACSCSSASALYAGICRSRDQVADAAGYCLLDPDVAFFGWLFLSRDGRARSASGCTRSASCSSRPRCSGRSSSRRVRR